MIYVFTIFRSRLHVSSCLMSMCYMFNVYVLHVICLSCTQKKIGYHSINANGHLHGLKDKVKSNRTWRLVVSYNHSYITRKILIYYIIYLRIEYSISTGCLISLVPRSKVEDGKIPTKKWKLDWKLHIVVKYLRFPFFSRDFTNFNFWGC